MSDSVSTADSSTDNTQRQGRQVAKRAFAAELNDATHVFTESDEERAPNFALLPSGESANRYFFVGTITEVTDVGKDSEYWQARIVDPTGTVFAYAGQYQPEAAAFLSQLEPPAYVALTAKPSTYETDDGDVNVSLRPETITHVDEATRNQWVRETVERMATRLEAFESDNVDGSNPYIAMSREQYGETLSLDTYHAVLNDAREDVGMDAVPVPDSGPGVDEGESEEEDHRENEDAIDEAALAAAVANADRAE
ncbi:DNA-binding protein [Haloplanus halophilus]|uniref:DNA-binding protein n=1 Tax=Haloplanus halophilus TaxID=2949993 RepID=UPI00203F10FB|nr:DNA-binding protein [Haloplanus sp. GDY1]